VSRRRPRIGWRLVDCGFPRTSDRVAARRPGLETDARCRLRPRSVPHRLHRPGCRMPGSPVPRTLWIGIVPATHGSELRLQEVSDTPQPLRCRLCSRIEPPGILICKICKRFQPHTIDDGEYCRNRACSQRQSQDCTCGECLLACMGTECMLQ